jgi:hypothetical protein
MDAEAPRGLARGEETVLRRAPAKQRTKLLTCAWVRAQLIENRHDQCVCHSRLSAGSLAGSSDVVMRVGEEVCCGWHVLDQTCYEGESGTVPAGAQLEAEAVVVSIIFLEFRAFARVASAALRSACGAAAWRR